MTIGLMTSAALTVAVPVTASADEPCVIETVRIFPEQLVVGLGETASSFIEAGYHGGCAEPGGELSGRWDTGFDSAVLYPVGPLPGQMSGEAVADPGALRNAEAGPRTTHLAWSGTPSAEALSGAAAPVTLLRMSATQMNSGPLKVKKGKKVRIWGAFERVNWDTQEWESIDHEKVRLQFRPKGGRYSKIKTMWTSRSNSQGYDGGIVGPKVKMTRSGCYRWAYAGTATVASSNSNVFCFKVKH